MERNLKNFIILAIVLTILFFVTQMASAHGGGGGSSEKKKEEPVAKTSRRAPQLVRILTAQEMQAIAEDIEYQKDVVTVKCMLNAFAVCRGVDISLSQLDGKKVITANTGTQGTVGFEGLKPDTAYVVSLESKRYKGQANVRPGRSWVVEAYSDSAASE